MKVKEKTIKRLFAMLAVGLLSLSTLTPALATTATEISGNGADSENEIEVETEQEQVVVQQNWAVVRNFIETEVSSGDNEAEDDTNGDVAIHTGAATANVNVNNKVNANVALFEDCPGCQEDIGAKISDNGAGSENEIEVESEVETEIFQENWAEIDNCVEAEVESGDNEAENNTGGDVTITTGPATANVNLNNLANANWAAIVSGFGSGPAWKGAEISGNGADSENEIEIEQERSIAIVQDNWADIFNRVETEVESGDNEAEDNTGGDVAIHTGPATANLNLNNKANFNLAEVECCLFDKTAKVSGNGAESENEVEIEHEDDLYVFQNGQDSLSQETDLNGGLSFENWVKAEPESGDNEADHNTGPEENDPVVVTTNPATANVNVNNEGGVNAFVRGEFPCFPELPQLWFDFNLGEVFGFFW